MKSNFTRRSKTRFRLKLANQEVQAVMPEEAADLAKLRNIRRIRKIALVLISTGMRRGELCALKTRDGVVS